MSNGDLATSVGYDPKDTEVGSVFVSNYPPFSTWGEQQVAEAEARFLQAPRPQTPLGVYLHIPFCRKRCKFCYFKVYTDKNSKEVDRYVEALGAELTRRVEQPAISGRPIKFIYFGGGTPSYISSRHLKTLFARMRDLFDWSELEEVTFECEPGTLTERKVATLRELGVTRLSLGIENWDDAILRDNGRAHETKEIHRALPWIEAADFDQVNIDLISGMVGETNESWKDSIAKTIEMAPGSVTIYQMELPFNTVYSRKVLDEGQSVGVADWATKRAWHNYAMNALGQAGYDISSAYTMTRRGSGAHFVYRNSVWQGCDLLAAGVSSFGHISGMHYQNAPRWADYLDRVDAGASTIQRALEPTPEERLTREFILQLKLGRLDVAPLGQKHGVDVLQHFAGPLERLQEQGMLDLDGSVIDLTRDGLLRVDSLLPNFYAERYQNARYT